MLRRVDEADTMIGIGEKGSSCLHGMQDAGLAFDTELLKVKTEPTALVHHTHQGFGLVGVELVDDEQPVRFSIRVDGSDDMRGKVLLSTGWTNRGSDDLSCGHFEVGNEGLRAVADVLELTPLHPAGFHGQRGVLALQGLNAGLLIGAHHPHPLLMEFLSLSVDIADGSCFLVEAFRVLGSAARQPVARQMRL